MKAKPIDIFLADLEGHIYYQAVKMATQTDWKVQEIADHLGITFKLCDNRIYYGALYLGIRGGRAGLKNAYISYLEEWINDNE